MWQGIAFQQYIKCMILWFTIATMKQTSKIFNLNKRMIRVVIIATMKLFLLNFFRIEITF